MLGVEYQSIYCKITTCPHNEKHTVRDGKTNKVTDVYYTCEKEDIYIGKNGKCKDA